MSLQPSLWTCWHCSCFRALFSQTYVLVHFLIGHLIWHSELSMLTGRRHINPNTVLRKAQSIVPLTHSQILQLCFFWWTHTTAATTHYPPTQINGEKTCIFPAEPYPIWKQQNSSWAADVNIPEKKRSKVKVKSDYLSVVCKVRSKQVFEFMSTNSSVHPKTYPVNHHRLLINTTCLSAGCTLQPALWRVGQPLGENHSFGQDKDTVNLFFKLLLFKPSMTGENTMNWVHPSAALQIYGDCAYRDEIVLKWATRHFLLSQWIALRPHRLVLPLNW